MYARGYKINSAKFQGLTMLAMFLEGSLVWHNAWQASLDFRNKYILLSGVLFQHIHQITHKLYSGFWLGLAKGEPRKMIGRRKRER